MLIIAFELLTTLCMHSECRNPTDVTANGKSGSDAYYMVAPVHGHNSH